MSEAPVFLVMPKEKMTRELSSLSFDFLLVPPQHFSQTLKESSPSCVLFFCDDEKGEELESLIELAKAYDLNLPIIVLASSQSPELAVSMMKQGVFDYFLLPLDQKKLKLSVERACHLYQLTKKVYLLQNQVSPTHKLDRLLGQSEKMQEVFSMIQMLAKSKASVLVCGESGTGKELVAKAIHHLGPRASENMLDINCGAIPKELLENEMFGHERGAYTGADKRYIGSVEHADKGTLFLDEISEMDITLQVKLLRFLQERTITRIGGTEVIPVDVRVIAATNKNLETQVKEGKFREDLYYRLNVVQIYLPALRERREDVPMLAQFFLDKYSSRNNKIFIDFSPEALEALVQYDWPGNVRELENTIERLVVLHTDSQVKKEYLPKHMLQTSNAKSKIFSSSHKSVTDQVLPLSLVEKYAIESALVSCSGSVSEAAKRLQIGQATLYRKIKEYGLRNEEGKKEI